MPRSLALALFTSLSMAACGDPPDARDSPANGASSGAVSAAAATPESVLAAVEDALLSPTNVVAIEFTVSSEGAFPSSIEGTLELGGSADAEGGVVDLQASGVFGPDSVFLGLTVEGGELAWWNGGQVQRDSLPAALREGVVIGFTRMGILHNLARLTAAQPPDRTDGTVRSWVQAEELTWHEGEPAAGVRGISFLIRVAGQPSGQATLWLDEDDRPVGRDQVVVFPGGEMRVEERYRLTR